MILLFPLFGGLFFIMFNFDDDFIIVELDSKSEEYDMIKKELNGLSEALVELGFYEMEITTAINLENQKRIYFNLKYTPYFKNIS